MPAPWRSIVSRPTCSALVAYDLKTGAELGRIDAGGLGSVAAITGDTIIFGSYDLGGAVRAIGPERGRTGFRIRRAGHGEFPP